MNAVGYIRIEFSGSKLPYTAAPYKGLQSRLTPQLKFDSLLTFSAVRAPTVTFTFDDSHASDFDVAIGCLERPRPGFPDGMRGTFHVIASNIGEPGECTLAELQKMSASGHEVCLHIYRKVHHAAPNVGGDGPLAHYVLVDPGGDSADIASEIAWLGAAGLPGPFADAYPAGQVAPDTVAAGVSHGLTALRTTSDGGGIPIISGSGATATCTGFDLSHLTERFMTNPPGAPWRVPGVGWLRDAVNRSKDLRGFTITIRLIYEAAVQGAKCVTYTHEMYGPGVVPSDGGSWNADMFNTVLDYVSDLVVGGNTSGFNAAGDHFPDLRVQTLTQAVAGVTPGAAVPEAFGVAV
jgi:peptidoglycan/xylan/chitin deacetylase (PgdA/CDA1 family)